MSLSKSIVIIFLTVVFPLAASSNLNGTGQPSQEAQPISGQATISQTCADIFEELQAAHNDPSIELGYLYSQQKVLELTGPVETRFGKLYEIMRTGLIWTTDYRTMPFDPQGNPQWTIYLFGRKAAEALGVKMLGVSDSRMTIPGIDYLNGVIKQINLVLPEKFRISTHFYPDTPSKTKLTRYLENFQKEASLPMGIADNGIETAIHDLSFHLPSIILPNEVLNVSQDLAGKVLEFTTLIQERFKGTPHEETANKMKTALRLQWVHYLDEGTARIMGSMAKMAKLAPEEQRNNETITKIFTEAFPVMLGRYDIYRNNTITNESYKGANAEGFFRTITPLTGFTSVFKDVLTLNSDHWPPKHQPPREAIAAFRELAKSVEFQNLENQFIENWEKNDPHFNTNRLPPLKTLCLKMNQKRAAIIAALENLKDIRSNAPLIK